jgi:hypothetical protein
MQTLEFQIRQSIPVSALENSLLENGPHLNDPSAPLTFAVMKSNQTMANQLAPYISFLSRDAASSDSHAAGNEEVDLSNAHRPAQKCSLRNPKTERLLQERSRLLTDVRVLDVEIHQPEAERLQRFKALP